jgi:hypothetical protein
MKKQVITAPQRFSRFYDYKSLFLAGSIEMDTAEKWQDEVIKEFSNDKKYSQLRIFNPRRKEGDSSWEHDINSKNFYEQVTWELDALDESEVIAMYFDPNTKSPISLMELGLYAESTMSKHRGKGKLVVCCPEGFWRKGNVDIVCQRYNIPVFSDWDTWIFELKRKLR